jgi:hypothetical protein
MSTTCMGSFLMLWCDSVSFWANGPLLHPFENLRYAPRHMFGLPPEKWSCSPLRRNVLRGAVQAIRGEPAQISGPNPHLCPTGSSSDFFKDFGQPHPPKQNCSLSFDFDLIFFDFLRFTCVPAPHVHARPKLWRARPHHFTLEF